MENNEQELNQLANIDMEIDDSLLDEDDSFGLTEVKNSKPNKRIAKILTPKSGLSPICPTNTPTSTPHFSKSFGISKILYSTSNKFSKFQK